MAKTIKVGAIQPEAKFLNSDQFEEKIMALVQDAVGQGAELLVFPEDVGLWLEKIDGPRLQAMVQGPTAAQMPEFDGWLADPAIAEEYKETFSTAARTYGVPIVGGSIYEKQPDGNIYNRSYVFDKDGTIAGHYDKRHLTPEELSYGASESAAPCAPVKTKDYRIGVCICYDLNFGRTELPPETPQDTDFRKEPYVVEELKKGRAQIICAGSLGFRRGPDDPPYVPPFHRYSDQPQIRRAQETKLAVVRAYQCGHPMPGVYMAGWTDIVLPDGSPVAEAHPNDWQKELVYVREVPLA
ncbi:MAG: carbon-nitrogen hydrolase family protein [Armatimonadetes bacterium]|nr:carbon-nitrogen hydrolase family protein [Armatimonadota bacterium]